MKNQSQRILARVVARELSREDLERVSGGSGYNTSSDLTSTWKAPWNDGDTDGAADDE